MKFLEWFEENQAVWMENAVLAGYLNRAADAIANIVGEKVVVILGRDAWPLVPLLRYRGVRTQYFLYSRLQIGDKSTKLAWLREVPRRSYIVDTGYTGSIINDIKTFDPSVKGILLSSNGYYPELDVQDKLDRDDIIGDLEHTPKIIDRSSGYNGPYAKVKPENKDSDFGGKDNREKVEKANQELLKLSGLPDEMVQQYKNFSGISPKDRLGHDDYLSHWRRVERSRNSKIKNRPEWMERWEIASELAKKGKAFEWNWYWEIPPRIKEELIEKAHELYNDAELELKEARNKLKSIPSWDEDHQEEAHAKLLRKTAKLNNILRLVKPVVNFYSSYYQLFELKQNLIDYLTRLYGNKYTDHQIKKMANKYKTKEEISAALDVILKELDPNYEVMKQKYGV